MRIGVVGLGRMGGNIARRLLKNGHECAVFDANPDTVKQLTEDGAQGAATLEELVQSLPKPRSIWLMLPAGDITNSTIKVLEELLDEGDTVIEGGNAFYKDDVARAETFAKKGISYLDVGVSGGVWGLDRGYCMMIGGDKEVFERHDPIFATLAPGEGSIPKTPGRENRDPRVLNGYLYCGPVGSGHFVKMVHNGIEYGMMQAYAEGFDIMRNKNLESLPANLRYDLDMADIAEVWRRGSVVSSWLLDLISISLADDINLDEFSGQVSDSGEGRWTIEAAIEEAVPANVLTASLYTRFRSRSGNSYGEKLLSAMRNQFGGHVEAK